MKKVLIITYYWPPTGGGGVQRWVKFVKYFSLYNWEPIILTPENPTGQIADNSLLKDVPNDLEVLKVPIWEPYLWYKKLTRQKHVYSGFIQENATVGFLKKFSLWVRSNFFIPDARKFWIKPATQFLIEYLKNNKVDVLLSTGPPHSMHLIALNVKNKYPNIPWIADFRDPWTDIDFYNHLLLTKWANNLHHVLEKKVLDTADEIVTVSNHCALGLERIRNKNISVITNGYDHEDFELKPSRPLDQKFTITHIGSMNSDRNPETLWCVLADLKEKVSSFGSDLCIQLIGPVDHTIISSIKRHSLEKNLKHISFLEHLEAIKHMAQSQILLLCINDSPNAKGVVPGKFFEYLGSKRPIISIDPVKGDAAQIIEETKSGVSIGNDEKQKLSELLYEWYNLYKTEGLYVKAEGIEQYKRKNLAKRYVKILENIY